VDAALDRSDDTVSDVLGVAHLAGLDTRVILEDVVGGAAAELGRRWLDDELSFLDVTIGSAKLHRAVHDLRNTTRRRSAEPLGRVLVTTPPGEQHALGAAVAEQMLWEAGCDTVFDPRGSSGIDGKAADGFDAVAIAVPCERSVDRLGQMVERLRSGARDGCRIVLAGRAATPEMAVDLGADGFVDGVDDMLARLG